MGEETKVSTKKEQPEIKLSVTSVKEKAIVIYIYVVKIVLTVVIMVGLYNIVLNFNTKQLRFDAFIVPIGLEERGYTGEEIAGRISDHITYIRNSVTSHVKMYQVLATDDGQEEEIPEFEVPGAGISFNSIVRYMQMFFGQQAQRVYGSVTESNALRMVVRISGMPSKTLINKKHDIDVLIEQAAEHVLMHLEPFSLALYYKEKKNIDALKVMVKKLNKVSVLEQDKVSIQVISSFIFSLQRNNVDALKAAEQAVKLNPKHSYALHNYSLALVDVNQLEESLAIMRRLTDVLPDWSTYNNMAYVLMMQGKYDEGIEEVQQSIQMNPACAQCFDTWAIILDEKDDYTAALQKVSQAMDLALPSDFDYYYNFKAKLYTKLAKHKAAIQAYQQVIKTNPEGQYALSAAQNIKKLEILEDVK